MNLLKRFQSLFKRRPAYTWYMPNSLTRWHLIGNYTFNCDSYVTFARGDRFTGELFFNTKKVCSDDHGKCLSKIDTQSAWDRLLADVGAGESDLADNIREQLREQYSSRKGL